VDDGAISLTAGFAPADEATWRALVDRTLNGASFEKRLVSKTYDGIDIQPLYTAVNAAAPLANALRPRATFDADRVWDIRASVDHPDPTQANKLVMAELEGGASSLLLKIDPSGQDGVAIASKADLEQTLDGVLFDLAPVALDAGFLGPLAARWLHEVAKSKTLKPHLQLHLDPLGAFARAGASPGPIEGHLADAAKTGMALDAETACLASGQAVHEAGGTDAQEIATVAACGLAYIQALADAGLGLDQAVQRIALGLAADADYFATMAKVRAARIVWAKVTTALGCQSPKITIEARSSRRMLSTLDPWVNMLRLTSAAFGASLGGADSIVLDSFTQPLGRPTPFARRQARNIQLVLMEEVYVGRVADPAGGAWFMETLADKTARAAWTFFQAIEKQGGIVPAFKSGFIADHVARAREARVADVAKRKTGLVGVSEFPSLLEPAVETDPVDPLRFAKPSPTFAKVGPNDACPPLQPWRASEAFEIVRARARAMTPPPTASLVTLGAPRDYTARVSFARNTLAAGGIAAETGEVANYEAATTPIAVICGSDAGYAESGGETARALKTKGAKLVYLAGKPGDLEADLKAEGVDGFIFTGADIRATVEGMLASLQAGDPA
jgi:methylmalonyl-CoA mutase